MNRNVVFALALTCAVAQGARAESIFVAPVNEDNTGATAITRAVETALLEKAPTFRIITPNALDQQLELDIVAACRGNDEGQCVTQFAESLDVDYILRPSLARLGSVVLLTLTLYDGRKAAVVSQGQRQRDAADQAQLLDEVPALVLEVAKKGGLPVREEPVKRFPTLGVFSLVGGSLATVVGGGILALSIWQELRYQNATLSREDAGSWETARIFGFGAGGLFSFAGLVLAGYGLYAIVE